ncbi:hypothetical protein [Nocardioides ultimimeridianus]
MSHLVRRSIAGAAACAAVAAPLTLGHGPAAQARATSHTLRFTSHSLAGSQLGQRFGGADKLVRNGTVVGFDVVSGTVGPDGVIHLRGAFSLAGGLMYVTGTVKGTSGTGRVTGGTGRYAGATGTVRDTIVNPDKGIVSTVVTWSS